MTAPTTAARNAGLVDLQALLMADQARKVDFVLPATKIRAREGLIHVAGVEAHIGDDGVTQVDGIYRPSAIFDEGLADKLGIPLGYLRRLRADATDLYDRNVNGWLHGRSITRASGTDVLRPADPRRFLFRGYTAAEQGGEGVARALLSDSFKMLEHLDAITAALQGVRDAGVDAVVVGCDLSDRRMTVRVAVPQVRALAPILLDGYRTPWGRGEVRRAGDHDGVEQLRQQLGTTTDPVVFSGFVVSNSETGGGALTVTPRATILACMNGVTVNVDAQRAVHVGGKLADDGLITWSDTTQQASIDLVRAKTADVVKSVCSPEYLQRLVARVEAEAGVAITDADATVTRVAKALKYDEATTRDVLAHFIMGGQMTAGGVMNAVTSVAQTIPDADRAADVEATAMDALRLAAAV